MMLITTLALAVAQPIEPADALARFHLQCGSGRGLWGRSLCGPILFADPATKTLWASEDPGVEGFVRQDGRRALWRGSIPPDLTLANTKTRFGGRDWAMILLPLPDDADDTQVLLAHESFHRLQSVLGYQGREGANPHLDSEAGRIFARLEARALTAALYERGNWRPHARAALAYRTRRLKLTKGAEGDETALINN